MNAEYDELAEGVATTMWKCCAQEPLFPGLTSGGSGTTAQPTRMPHLEFAVKGMTKLVQTNCPKTDIFPTQK